MMRDPETETDVNGHSPPGAVTPSGTGDFNGDSPTPAGRNRHAADDAGESGPPTPPPLTPSGLAAAGGMESAARDDDAGSAGSPESSDPPAEPDPPIGFYEALPQRYTASAPHPAERHLGAPQRSVDQPDHLGEQDPPPLSQQPRSHRAADPPPPPAQTSASPNQASQGWHRAQGSAANWNYLDAIRHSEMVPTRRIPPRRGWRKAVYLGSFKQINPGRSRDERYQAELEEKIRSLLRGKYKIAVLGKGGAGKSTIAASVGSVFAELRQEDRVVAVDADPAFGKLGTRVDPSASGSYWEVAADRDLDAFTDIRSKVGHNSSGLFVLAGESATARRRLLDPEIYREATAQLDKHFGLSIVDCGTTMDAAITRAVLDDADALIVVSSPWYDAASAAGQTLEWLANEGYTALLHRTVLVINDSDGHAGKADRARLAERFSGRGQKVIEMPFDAHLRPGGVVDAATGLNKVTRRRLLELAAACAEHFAATTDQPRKR